MSSPNMYSPNMYGPNIGNLKRAIGRLALLVTWRGEKSRVGIQPIGGSLWAEKYFWYIPDAYRLHLFYLLSLLHFSKCNPKKRPKTWAMERAWHGLSFSDFHMIIT